MTKSMVRAGRVLAIFCGVLAGLASSLPGAEPSVPVATQSEVNFQPLNAQIQRVVDALGFLGQPLPADVRKALTEAANAQEPSVERLQEILDPLVLAVVEINPESRVKASRGPAPARLVEQGWTVYPVKVMNQAGITPQLRASSPNAAPLYKRSTGSPDPRPSIAEQDVPDRWLDIEMFDNRPLTPALTGLPVEYRLVQLYSRQGGSLEGKLLFDVGQGTQDLGFRNELPILFDCERATDVVLEVQDENGQPTMGQFVVHDQRGRVYPSRSRRLAPDFFFHDQVYRRDGESILLPPGDYEVTYSRGPEYVIETRKLTVKEQPRQIEQFALKRWIHMAKLGWFSGDHHVHAAGCAHYEAPTQGVTPEVMMRHILGEDLNVGCVLSWGPCWYFQKQFFEGATNKLSTDNYLMRYDIEVSGFPSSHAGHLCLLRLREDDYPGTTLIEQWPSWDLPVLKWGKQQGGVVGFSHSGWGLEIKEEKLPSYEMPKFDGIGANEYVVDVVHDACDFISSVDTPINWELNVWYHTLNCGMTCRISGETDFPCIYGQRVGLGRAYVQLDPDGPLDFDRWVEKLRDGRSYCCDGLSHLPNFAINGFRVGQIGDGGRASFLGAKSGSQFHVTAQAAALLEPTPREDIRRRALSQQPYWHVERARVDDSDRVPVELIVNGQSVARTEIVADGTLHDVEFDVPLERSSWVALRIYPSSHTNPIFVELDGQPIRASRRSAQWCRDAVDVCWESKVGQIRDSEQEAAKAAYDYARRVYEQIREEAFDDRQEL